MAYRTDETEIGKIIEVDSSISDLSPFIAIANELVTECCSDSGYSTTRLAQIETWLAAHFYAIRDPRAVSEKAGSVSTDFQFKTNLQLFQTRYGQTAMLLDTGGGLAALSKRTEKGRAQTVGVTWLGSDYSASD